MAVRLQGLDRVIANLNREVRKIANAGMAGLWDAGLQIQAASQRRVPVDTGNLRASHYVRSMAPGSIEIGASANYAVYVHENMEAHHPVGEAKFLEHAISENYGNIIEIIRRRAML